MLKIASIGEAMVELSLQPDGQQAAIGYAGDTLNSAIYLKRLLPKEHQVSFISVVGQDQFSDNMFQLLSDEAIDSRYLKRHDSKLPGIYAISKNAEGDRTFSYWRENSAARSLFADDNGTLDFSILDDFNVLYLSAITLAILPPDVVEGLFDYLGAFRKRGGQVAFDSNYRSKLWQTQRRAQDVISKAWHLTDIGLPSIDDEMLLFDASEDETIKRFQSYQIPVLILKRGSAGPCAMIDGKLMHSDQNFEPVAQIIDTTAAGDSFNGGFLARYLTGGSLEASMLEGHEMAAKVVTCQGAIIPK